MRSRELGIGIGELEPGPLDASTDVDGVRVGHTTLIEGDAVRTGVTVVVPPLDVFAAPRPAERERRDDGARVGPRERDPHDARRNHEHALDGDALLEVVRRYGR